MRLQPLLATLALTVAASSAQAQFAVYATVSPLHASNVETGTVYQPVGSTYTATYTSLWTTGVGGGFSWTFIPAGPVKVGFDLRGSTKPGTSGADTGLFGIKVGVKAPLIRFKPYGEVAVGYIGTRTTNLSTYPPTGTTIIGGTFHNEYAAWEVLGGVDYALAPFLDLRMIEVGGGRGYSVAGYSPKNQQIGVLTLNSGLVVHF